MTLGVTIGRHPTDAEPAADRVPRDPPATSHARGVVLVGTQARQAAARLAASRLQVPRGPPHHRPREVPGTLRRINHLSGSGSTDVDKRRAVEVPDPELRRADKAGQGQSERVAAKQGMLPRKSISACSFKAPSCLRK